MGKKFDECVKKGGYIATIQKGAGKYQRTCSYKGIVTKSPVKKRLTK